MNPTEIIKRCKKEAARKQQEFLSYCEKNPYCNELSEDDTSFDCFNMGFVTMHFKITNKGKMFYKKISNKLLS